MLASYILLALASFKECFTVRFDYLGVPGSVLKGEAVWLDCGYDLEADELYSVKWYKDNYEFYRFLPSDQPPSQMLNLKGVFVDLYKSNATHVFLKAADLDTEGTYACEVSTDAPSFRTVRAEKELRVYVMPGAKPIIVGVMKSYTIGDEMNVTCFFGPSKPQAEVHWYLNGQPVPKSYVSVIIHRYEKDITSVESRLRFVVDPSHLWQGVLSIQCKASVSQVYSKSSEELIVGDGTSGAEFQRLTQVAPGQEGPSISGGMSRYDVGDLVDVNCTSARSLQPAELKWYINEEEAKPEFVMAFKPLLYPDGLISTKMSLKFRLHEDHFIGEEMRLKCTATLSKVIELSSVKTVYGGNQRSSEHLHVSQSRASDCSLCRSRKNIWLILVLCFFRFVLR